MSGDQIMAHAESLYSKGMISYPRTETDEFDPAQDIMVRSLRIHLRAPVKSVSRVRIHAFWALKITVFHVTNICNLGLKKPQGG